MEPILLIAAVLYAAFLLVLALVAFFAYRVAARSKEGGVGAGGGCLFATLIGGLGILGLIGFATFAGLVFARRAMQEHMEWRDGDWQRDGTEYFEGEPGEPGSIDAPATPAEPEAPEIPGAPKTQGAPGAPAKTGKDALDGAFDRGWAQHPDPDVKQY